MKKSQHFKEEGDGKTYFKLEIKESYRVRPEDNWYDGTFTYIKNKHDKMNHRFFEK